MWWKQGQRLTRLYAFRQRKFQLIDSRFQWKYTVVLAGGVGLFSLFAYSVAWYFIEQNYSIFIDYAYTHSPNFVSNLEFERRWIQNIIRSCNYFENIKLNSISITGNEEASDLSYKRGLESAGSKSTSWR
jgi:hypothetical protein